MASQTPADEIEDRLRAGWTTTPIFVGNPDDPRPPTDASGNPLAYVALEFPGGTTRQWTIGDPGNNVWFEDGAFMLHVMVPSGTRLRVARGYADQIAALFRGQESSGGVMFRGPFAPGDSGRADGSYAGVSFGVPYHYEFTG